MALEFGRPPWAACPPVCAEALSLLPPQAALSRRVPATAVPPNSRIVVCLVIMFFSF
ncbi:hypothetical protein GCM10029978_009820 [Actinoallomurus acanthiterrae]